MPTHRGRIVRALVVAALAVTSARAGLQPGKDLLRISPEELRGTPIEKLRERANSAYREKKWEESARAWVELLRASPGNPLYLYNLACCYALLGASEQAVRFLGAAHDAGYLDLDYMGSDHDLDGVRASSAYRALADRWRTEIERRVSLAGIPISVAAPVLATVRVLAPADATPDRKLPLVVFLHGAGGSIDHATAVFAGNGIAQPFLLCAAQAPYAAGSGFVWFQSADRELRHPTPVTRRLSELYVLATITQAARSFAVDERQVYVMGFSQGAFLALSVGLRHPEVVRGVIAIGGWVNPDEFTSADFPAGGAPPRVLLCHSPEDRAVAYGEAETTTKFLRAHEVPYELVRYPGGHVLTREMLTRVAAWIRGVSPDAPAARSLTDTP